MNTKKIKIYKDLMGANEEWAAKIRELLKAKNILMLNLIGSPGAGKTTLLEKMAGALKDKLRFAVLEGDVETTKDAERLAALDIPVSQLLSGGSCHLEAKLVHHALADLDLDNLDVVIVENVGNLVCPAEFDIGEHAKIAVSSIIEGEDKPIKYPLLFREAKAVVVTKLDLLPHITADLDLMLGYIKQVNGTIPVFQVSSSKCEGFQAWLDWILSQRECLNA